MPLRITSVSGTYDKYPDDCFRLVIEEFTNIVSLIALRFVTQRCQPRTDDICKTMLGIL